MDETYLKVRGRWTYLYRASDRDGNPIDAMLSEHRDMQAANTFFGWALATIGLRPDRVTTDGHSSYPRAIRTVLGKTVRHRTNAYLNNRLEQDHRGIKGSARFRQGFKSHDAASRFVASTANYVISSDLVVVVTTKSSPPPPAVPASLKALASHSTS